MNAIHKLNVNRFSFLYCIYILRVERPFDGSTLEIECTVFIPRNFDTYFAYVYIYVCVCIDCIYMILASRPYLDLARKVENLGICRKKLHPTRIFLVEQ